MKNVETRLAAGTGQARKTMQENFSEAKREESMPAAMVGREQRVQLKYDNLLYHIVFRIVN